MSAKSFHWPQKYHFAISKRISHRLRICNSKQQFNINNILFNIRIKKVYIIKSLYLKIGKDNSFSFNKIFHSEKKIIETRYSIV